MRLRLIGGEHRDARLRLDESDGLVEQVGAERVRADRQHHVVPGQRVVQQATLPREVSGEQRVILREPHTPRERLLPDRAAQPLGERNHRIPVLLLRSADDKRRRLGARQQAGELRDLRRLHRMRAQDLRGRPGRELVGGLEPVAHRHHQQRRPCRGLGLVIGARDRAGHVLAAARDVPPHRILAGQALERSPGEERLEGNLATVLLAHEDHKRSAAITRVSDRVHRVAQTGRRVQVDERRLAPGECVAGRHPHHRSLVEAEDEPDVGREIGQKCDLGRSRVAEDRRQPVAAHDLESAVAHGHPGRPPAVPVAAPGRGSDARNLGHRGDPTCLRAGSVTAAPAQRSLVFACRTRLQKS